MTYEPRTPNEDEPVFQLMAGDPKAASFVRAYALFECGRADMAMQELGRSRIAHIERPRQMNDPKVRSALDWADKAERYYIEQALSIDRAAKRSASASAGVSSDVQAQLAECDHQWINDLSMRCVRCHLCGFKKED